MLAIRLRRTGSSKKPYYRVVVAESTNWRDVDAIIVRVGAFLRERDLGLAVDIQIGDVPVPVAGS